ncbi:MAG: chromate transporter, partial [Oscillospiraceae bacterium]|nr:chromate transporter [Oscillospiraceae bacterium]
GGLAMLPVIQRDIVEKYKFMPEEEFMEYATLSQTLPGVIALNCAVFVGRRTAGTPGMLAAGFGATISAFVLMIAATALLQAIPQSGPVIGALQGVRAAAAALILSAAFSLGRHNLKSAFAIIIMLAAFAVVFFTRVSALIVIIVAGLVGYAYQRFFKSEENREGSGTDNAEFD